MASMLDKISAGLNDVGYDGPLLKLSQLKSSIEIGQRDKHFTELVQFLTGEIRILLSIDEEVNAITCLEDAPAFVMEVTSFLKELNCPYTCLTSGIVSERLDKAVDRLLLLDYLLTELMSARILQEKKPEKRMELKLKETPEGADIRQILQTLRFPKPPPNITIKQLFDKLDSTIPLVVKKSGADLAGTGIFNGNLSKDQWDILKGVQRDLHKEYKIRREMMLTRLDVTIQSFQWSDKTKGKEEEFEKVYHNNRKALHAEPSVDISDLIAARTDIAIIEKTSNASVRKNTKTPLNKVMIGQVPDRGGRSWELAPPPPEMPSWQQNRTGPPGGSSAPRGAASGYNNQGTRGSFRGSGRGDGGYQGRNHQEGRGDQDNQRRRGGFDNRGGGSNYYNNRGGYDNYNRRDSGSGYEFQQNKRPKTYDDFQASKTTYADQYVQENQHNQQYRRGGFQRGRSNYHRGGGGGSGSNYR